MGILHRSLALERGRLASRSPLWLRDGERLRWIRRPGNVGPGWFHGWDQPVGLAFPGSPLRLKVTLNPVEPDGTRDTGEPKDHFPFFPRCLKYSTCRSLFSACALVGNVPRFLLWVLDVTLNPVLVRRIMAVLWHGLALITTEAPPAPSVLGALRRRPRCGRGRLRRTRLPARCR